MTTKQYQDMIENLATIAEQAITLADEYAGGESETAETLRDVFERIMQTYDHKLKD
jgi:hypothetical protein